MSGKLVETIFQTGPDDKLLAVDAYEGGGGNTYEGTETENSFDFKREEAIDVLQQLSSDTEIQTPDNFSQILGSETGTESYSPAEMFERMASEFPQIAGFLNDLSRETRNLFNLSPSKSDTSLNRDFNFKDANVLANIINTIAGQPLLSGFKDIGATKELIRQVSVIASNAGVTNTYQTIVKNPNINRDVIVDAATQSIKTQLEDKRTDILTDVYKAGILTDVIAKDSSIIPSILSSNSQSRDEIELSRIFDSFKENNDGWNTDKIGPLKVTTTRDYSLSDSNFDKLRRQVHSFGLMVYVNEDNQLNPAMDYNLIIPVDADIVKKVYGDNLDRNEVNALIAKSSSVEHAKLVVDFVRNADMYIGFHFNNTDLIKELNQIFPFINIRTNKIN